MHRLGSTRACASLQVGLVRVTDPLTGVLYALATEVRAGRTQLSIARGRMLQGAEVRIITIYVFRSLLIPPFPSGCTAHT